MTMASTVDFSLIREPQLLDLIDEAWAQEKLPDDGRPLPFHTESSLHAALACRRQPAFGNTRFLPPPIPGRHSAACRRPAAA